MSTEREGSPTLGKVSTAQPVPIIEAKPTVLCHSSSQGNGGDFQHLLHFVTWKENAARGGE